MIRNLEERALLFAIGAVTIAFLWLLWPYWGAVLWGIILALLFNPLQRWLTRRLNLSPNIGALISLLSIMLLVLLPLLLVAVQLVRQAQALFEAYQNSQMRPEDIVPKIKSMVPDTVLDFMQSMGLPGLDQIFSQANEALKGSAQFLAGQALNMGQFTLGFFVSVSVMLYLLYFLLRDGPQLFSGISRAIPLKTEHKRVLATETAVAIRATVLGSVVVALVQGALGGVMFWILGLKAPLLWGALMALLALLPVVGAGIVWLPAALFLIATGATMKGIVLIAYGILVIGLADNVLRPMLVGKQTRLPDWLVLLTSLGGIELLGTNGLLIGPVVATMFIAAWNVLSGLREQRDLEERAARRLARPSAPTS